MMRCFTLFLLLSTASAQQKCKNEKDVMIVIDQSGSVSAENFVKEKNFAAGLVDNLLEDDPRAQIGIVAFGGKSCVKMGTGQLDAYSCRKLTDAYSRDSSFNGGLSDCKEVMSCDCTHALLNYHTTLYCNL